MVTNNNGIKELHMFFNKLGFHRIFSLFLAICSFSCLRIDFLENENDDWILECAQIT